MVISLHFKITKIRMFKYVSDILSHFTSGQKITALILLLFTIIVLTLTPTIIKQLSDDCETLVNENTILNEQVDNLIKDKNKLRTEKRMLLDTIITVEERCAIEMVNQVRSVRKDMIASLKGLKNEYVQYEENKPKVLPSIEKQEDYVIHQEIVERVKTDTIKYIVITEHTEQVPVSRGDKGLGILGRKRTEEISFYDTDTIINYATNTYYDTIFTIDTVINVSSPVLIEENTDTLIISKLDSLIRCAEKGDDASPFGNVQF